MIKNKVFDAFTFWCELDVLLLRMSILDEFVDYFILVESEQTFSGVPKPLYYQDNIERFAKWKDKIIVITAPNIEIKETAFERHWLCYELIEQKLMEIGQPDDIAFCSDLDEIWNPDLLKLEMDDNSHSLYQLAYAYWLNNRCSEQWTGTLMTKIKNIFVGFNKLNRTAKPFPLLNGGWHMTNMGGVEMIINKIEAYDHTECNQQWVKDAIKERVEQNQDYLSRLNDYNGNPFKFWVDEQDWLQYLKDNKEKWSFLCK